jgi:hypothetical protein
MTLKPHDLKFNYKSIVHHRMALTLEKKYENRNLRNPCQFGPFVRATHEA